MLEVVLLGDSRVGKSSLLERFCCDSFSSGYHPTTHISYKYRHITSTTQKLKLKIWDTVSQDPQTDSLSCYCNEATGFILMYSIGNADSLKNLSPVIETLKKNINGKFNAVIIGNKLSEKEAQISTEDIQYFTGKHDLKHYEVNIRDDLEVDEPFLELVSSINNELGKKQNNMDAVNKVSEILLDGKHPQTLVSEDFKITNIRTRHPSYIGEKSSIIGIREGEELETTIRKLIKEVLLEGQFDNDICYGMFQKKPVEEVILEYKQELIDLALNFDEFKAFITREIEQINEQTKEQLKKIEEKHNLPLKVDLHQSKSIPDTQLELDFYDNNFPQTTVNIGSQSTEEEIYKLKQKMEGYDKKLSEGLCYMENKLKLTCAELTKQVRHLSMSERVLETNHMTHKGLESKTTTHAAQTRRVSLFSPVAGMYRKHEVQNFGEAVEHHNLSLMHTPILAPRSSTKHELKHDIEGDIERRATSLDTLDLSSGEIHHFPDKLNLSMGFFEDHNEEQAQQDDRVTELNEEEKETSRQSDINEQAEEEYDEVKEETVDNYGDIKQEIASIWNTLNKVISNTQDCFHELKSEIANTSVNKEAHNSNFASMDKSVLEHRATIDSQHKHTSNPEKNVKEIIVEVKDEVHNQIVHVQKELEEKVELLREDILCQYASFSEKIQLEQFEVKKYVDEQIENTKQEIKEYLQNQYEENIIQSRLGLEDKEEQGLEPQNENLVQLQKEKEEREQKEKVEKDMIESLKNKLGNLEENVMNSVWNTLSLVAGRLEKVELIVKSIKK